MWTIFIRMDGKEVSEQSDDLEATLRSFCPDLWRGQVLRIEGPNGALYSIEDIKRLCADRGLMARR
jgi:hypothetical protein